MGVVNDAVEDGVGDGWLANDGVPFVDGSLGCDQGRLSAVALFTDIEDVEPLAVVHGVGAPVIEDQELDAGKFVDEPRPAAVEAGLGEVLEQL